MAEEMVRYEQKDIDMLPTNRIREELTKIRAYQALVQELLIKDLDYGVIPGTGNKPTLLKPGAEKIAKALGLVDSYSFDEKIENWDKMFFHYSIRCFLHKFGTDYLVSQGLGSCNSKEAKYQYRWVYENQIPPGTAKDSLQKQERKSQKGGKYWVYRMGNDDLASQVNTILKMAKKRSLVDAVLSAARLSAVFTQDLEDIASQPEEPPHNGWSYGEGQETRKDNTLPASAQTNGEPKLIGNKEKKLIFDIGHKLLWQDPDIEKFVVHTTKKQPSELTYTDLNKILVAFKEFEIPTQEKRGDESDGKNTL